MTVTHCLVRIECTTWKAVYLDSTSSAAAYCFPYECIAHYTSVCSENSNSTRADMTRLSVIVTMAAVKLVW